MKPFVYIEKADYKVLSVFVMLIATVSAVLLERALFYVAKDSAQGILEEYKTLFSGADAIDKGYYRYLIHSELKKFIILLVLSFSAFGFPVNLVSFYLKIYRYIFFAVSIYRCELGSSYLLGITAVVLCLLLSIPLYFHLLGLSYRSYLYCNNNAKRFYHCTKYKLQSEVKICIIILIYIVFASLIETIACGYLFSRMFRL